MLPWLTVGYSTGRLYGTVPAIYSATVPLPTVTITVSSARLFDGRWCQGRAKPRDRQYNASNPSHPNSPPTHSLSGTQTQTQTQTLESLTNVPVPHRFLCFTATAFSASSWPLLALRREVYWRLDILPDSGGFRLRHRTWSLMLFRPHSVHSKPTAPVRKLFACPFDIPHAFSLP